MSAGRGFEWSSETYYRRAVTREGKEAEGKVIFLIQFLLHLHFWLSWVFIAARGAFSRIAAARLLFVALRGFSFQWLLLLQSTASRLRASVAAPPELWSARVQWAWLAGLSHSRHVGGLNYLVGDLTQCPLNWQVDS